MILTRWKEKKYALFIELKTSYSKEKEKKFKLQFEGAQCLLEYIDIVLKRFVLGHSILERFERRFIVVYKSISLNKSPTRRYTPKQETITSPVSFRKIQYREILNLGQLMA
ncbi:MAG: hypothetical protein JXR73_07300 [Candidatus Omnitrophica bacterium]|nr:hypothetical protein [Candidatus Omnitrophota bacterium]